MDECGFCEPKSTTKKKAEKKTVRLHRWRRTGLKDVERKTRAEEMKQRMTNSTKQNEKSQIKLKFIAITDVYKSRAWMVHITHDASDHDETIHHVNRAALQSMRLPFFFSAVHLPDAY